MGAMSQELDNLRRRLAWLGGGNVNAGRWALHMESRRIRCGSPGCRCRRGELHGPYVYARTGRAQAQPRRRIYVPQRHVRTVRRWLRDFRRARADMRRAMRLVDAICR